jgi:hypothetical protein
MRLPDVFAEDVHAPVGARHRVGLNRVDDDVWA